MASGFVRGLSLINRSSNDPNGLNIVLKTLGFQMVQNTSAPKTFNDMFMFRTAVTGVGAITWRVRRRHGMKNPALHLV